MATDPVCGMTVDEKSSAGTFFHAGTTYYSCSSHCLQKLQAHPADFLRKENGEATSARNQSRPAEISHPAHTYAGLKAAVEQGKAKDPICAMVVDKATALRNFEREAHEGDR